MEMVGEAFYVRFKAVSVCVLVCVCECVDSKRIRV